MKTPVRTFGRISDIVAANAPMDIWDGAAFAGAELYTFDQEPFTLYLSSSNASDTIPAIVHGLNEDYTTQTKVVTLAGQSAVEVPGKWLRVFFLRNADTGTLFVGTIYAALSGTLTVGVPDDVTKLRAVCQPDLQSSAQGWITIPKGHQGKLLSITTSIVPKSSQSVHAKIGVFVAGREKALVGTAYFGIMTHGSSVQYFPIKVTSQPLLAFEDLSLRIMSISSNDAEITCAFELELEQV